MIKLFCDLCDKEITDENFVEQSIFIHFKLLEHSGETLICKDCWEKEENSELLCKKQLNPIEEKELNTSHNSTFM